MEKIEQNRARARRGLIVLGLDVVAIVAACVCLLAIGGIGLSLYHQPDTLADIDDAAMRHEVKAARDAREAGLEEAARSESRETDRKERIAYLRSQHGLQGAGYALLMAGAVLVLTMKLSGHLSQSLPQPKSVDPQQQLARQEKRTSAARWSIAAVAFVLAGAGFGVAMAATMQEKPNPDIAKAPAPKAAPVAVAPTDGSDRTGTDNKSDAASNTDAGESAQPTPKDPTNDKPTPATAADDDKAKAYLNHWPQLRGPNGLGVANFKNVPVSFDAKKNENILWKIDLPLGGYASPIIFQDKVFISGGSKDRQMLFCYSTKDGKKLWEGSVGKQSPQARQVQAYDDATYAASTPATDGRRVYVIYCSGDIAAFDLEGKKLWEKALGVPENEFGYGSSLAVLGETVIAQLDMGEFADLVAFDGKTGNEAWRQSRDVGISWASPVIIHVDGKPQIVTVSVNGVLGHDPAAKGKVIWRAGEPQPDSDGTLAASAAYGNGLVLAVDPDWGELIGIKPGSKGKPAEVVITDMIVEGEEPESVEGAEGKTDEGKGKVTWKAAVEDIATVPSPVADDEFAYVVHGYGLAAVNLKDGKIAYNEEVDDFWPGYGSPTLVGDKLYLPTEDGVFFILARGKQYKKLGVGKLHESVATAPAFAEGRIYVRAGDEGKILFCIGEKK